MASSPAPHLLTMPREIRDQIYSYLHREVKLNGPAVSLGNVPYVAVLLAHSRLHEEYKEADCFQNLSMTIDMHWSGFHRFLEASDMSAPDKAAINRVRHVTLRGIKHGMTHPSIRMVLKVIESDIPRLLTLRVSEWCIVNEFTTSDLPLEHSYYARTMIPSPLPVLAGLSLVQSAGGRYSSYDPHPLYNLDLTANHVVQEISVVSYANTVSSNIFWTLEETAALYRWGECSPSVLARLQRERPEVMELLSHKLLGWKDQRWDLP